MKYAFAHPGRQILCSFSYAFAWKKTFQYRWLRGYIYCSCYYHHQIGSIHLSYCYHIFPWLCAWDVCYIIFWHLLHILSGKLGICFIIIVQFMMSANSRIRFGLQIVIVCLHSTPSHCPACRTSLIATRFWVVMICPIIKCLTVLRVFFYFVWFVFIHHNFQFYFELCTYCNILDIYLSQNLNFVNYLLFYMKLLNYLFFNMFGSVLECCELTGVSLL